MQARHRISPATYIPVTLFVKVSKRSRGNYFRAERRARITWRKFNTRCDSDKQTSLRATAAYGTTALLLKRAMWLTGSRLRFSNHSMTGSLIFHSNLRNRRKLNLISIKNLPSDPGSATLNGLYRYMRPRRAGFSKIGYYVRVEKRAAHPIFLGVPPGMQSRRGSNCWITFGSEELGERDHDLCRTLIFIKVDCRSMFSNRPATCMTGSQILFQSNAQGVNMQDWKAVRSWHHDSCSWQEINL